MALGRVWWVFCVYVNVVFCFVFFFVCFFSSFIILLGVDGVILVVPRLPFVAASKNCTP